MAPLISQFKHHQKLPMYTTADVEKLREIDEAKRIKSETQRMKTVNKIGFFRGLKLKLRGKR